jgi:hypoxanthine-DNA glycosylase
VEAQVTKHGLPPVARADARLFILGSLPGDASLSASRYYAHPRNHFWKLLGVVLAEPLADLPYEQRLDRLVERGVGLWDVIGSAVRPGSLDQAIRGAAHNPLANYFSGFPDLRAVAFNGSTSAAAGRRLLGDASFATIDLPSSSPANTRSFEAKLESWRILAQYL